MNRFIELSRYGSAAATDFATADLRLLSPACQRLHPCEWAKQAGKQESILEHGLQ